MEEPVAAEEPDSDTDLPPPQQRRRSICEGCDRPKPVCLCHVIPNPPIPTATRIVILQHPHESRHKLSTTPLITKSLSNAASAVARRLTPGLLRRLLPEDGSGDELPRNVFYLFPPTPSSPEAVSLSDLRQSLAEISSKGEASVVIAFDATWKHAKEMVAASEGYLSKFARRACLDGFDSRVEGGSIYESELLLRKEPCGGCVSTLEAVARWVGAAEEEEGGGGAEIEGRLIGLLREAVRLQAQFLKPVKPRPKLLKKNRRADQQQSDRT
ncbi:unnamed protein product [Linum trigynum]|uniref:tRNA-uridine aminocarboxypropyltransferase n=1 Tax=Linum trigynum TaxID=586398 RepID=A0AAV2CB13_9ROSI